MKYYENFIFECTSYRRDTVETAQPHRRQRNWKQGNDYAVATGGWNY